MLVWACGSENCPQIPVKLRGRVNLAATFASEAPVHTPLAYF